MAGRRMIKGLLVCGLLATLPLQARAQKVEVPRAPAEAVPLGDVMTLARPYPNLRQEIKLALIAAGDSKTVAGCAAARLGPEWTTLKGRAVGPYHCRIGNRTLDIKTSATYFDAAKHKIAPSDQRLTHKAVRLLETRLVWTWL
jgi:hypothetical protein